MMSLPKLRRRKLDQESPGDEKTNDIPKRSPGIRDWPITERPREKLLHFGPGTLTDAELLAIVLRTGTAGRNVIDLAREILTNDGSLTRLARKNVSELQRIRGLGKAKSVELFAMFEIGRRVECAEEEEVPVVHGPDDVARRMIPKLRDRRSEVFVLLVLDSRNGVKHESEVTAGTLNASLVHPREVYKCAIDHLAASIIVVHNHPSGNPEPSREDIEITRQLVEAGKIIGIPLHDHIVIGRDGYTSLAERQLM